MSGSIPTIEPAVIRAGDSLKWDRHLSDYPPSAGWALEYVFRAGVTVATFNASAVGDHFEIRIPAADTENLPPGQYRLIGRVSRNGDRYTVHESTISIEPDPALGPASHAETMVARLEAQIAALQSDVESWQQGDRAETVAKVADLRAQLNHYREEVRLQRGGPLFVPLPVEFRAP